MRETSMDHILAFALTDYRTVWIGVFIQIHLSVRKKRIPKATCVCAYWLWPLLSKSLCHADLRLSVLRKGDLQ